MQEVIDKLRSNIILSQSKSEQTALFGFDKLVEQLQVMINTINSKNTEIERLQKLCKANNIDYEPKNGKAKKESPPVVK